MQPNDEAVENAWMRSGARCECQHDFHGHGGRCQRQLLWKRRGQESRQGAWEARQASPRTAVVLEATQGCEILCWECYSQPLSGNRIPRGVVEALSRRD
jgi:hypothetical protein